MDRYPPDIMDRAEFVQARFHLEFQEPFSLTREMTLRLRRDLRQAGRLALCGKDGAERFAALFDPPLTSDPVALKRYQRPGPPFVIIPPAPIEVMAGDELALEVYFWGKGIHLLGDFFRSLQTLGGMGWHKGEGRFEMTAVECADPSGIFPSLWRPGREIGAWAPCVLEAQWRFERPLLSPPVELTLLTPARLLAAGRPLFRPTFTRIFPFLLRRVTSVLHSCCGIEPVDEGTPFLAAAARVEERESTLAWTDWRVLEGDGGRLDVGGVTGSVVLDGAGVEDVLWILQLAALMNVGKGASFGAGHLQVRQH